MVSLLQHLQVRYKMPPDMLLFFFFFYPKILEASSVEFINFYLFEPIFTGCYLNTLVM